MYPTIHNYTADTLKTQGYGALSDCISCEVTEVLNGEFTLELTYPLNGLHSEYLVPGNIIEVKPNHNQARQPFRISEVKKTFSNNIKVSANHISYDLSGYPVRAVSYYGTLMYLFDQLNEMTWDSGDSVFHKFNFDTDMRASSYDPDNPDPAYRPFSMAGVQTLRSWMGGQDGSIIDVYGGEWVYDNFNVFLTKRRGKDTGIRISYGKNIAEYEKQREYSTYSHICAYWKKSDDLVYSDLISTGIECTFRCAYYDATNEFEEKPSSTQLNATATAQVSKTKVDVQTVTVTPAQLGEDNIGLGDGVLICYDSVFSTRVVKTVWDALTETYIKLELGTKKQNISDTIKTLSTGPNGSSYSGGGLVPEVYTDTEAWGLRKLGDIVELRMYGAAVTTLNSYTLPAGYRPARKLSTAVVIVYNGKAYQGYITISTAGVLGVYYYNYGGTGNTPVNGSVIYGTYTYLLG